MAAKRCGPQRLCGRETCDECVDRSFVKSDKARFWSDENVLKPHQVFFSSGKLFLFDCDKCPHTISMKPNDIRRGRWCSYCCHALCDDEKCQWCFDRSFASHVKASEWSPNNPLPARQVRKHSSEYYELICSTCGHAFSSLLASVQSEEHCPFCAGRSLCENMSCEMCRNNSFASNPLSDNWSVINTLTPRQVFKSAKDKYWFMCFDCDHEFESYLNNVNKGVWCPYCRGGALCNDVNCDFCFKKSFASHVKAQFWATELNGGVTPRMITRCHNRKYWFTCDTCGTNFDSLINHVSHGSWCRFCTNKTESLLQEWLEEKGYQPICQFSPPWAQSIVSKKYHYS